MKTRYRAYIDEFGVASLKVGNRDDLNLRYLSLTAIIVDLDNVKSVISLQLHRFKNEVFNPHPDELLIFHLSDIRRASGPFCALNNPLAAYGYTG